MAFTELGVMPEIDRAVDEMGWMLPTDIQAESIGLILGGGDVLMAAETGSGKTGAFSIPVIQIVHEAKNQKEKGDKGGKGGPAGDVGPEGVRLNAFDRDADLAIQGNAAQARHFKSWYGARATHGVTGSGKWFFEMKCNDEGLSRVGFSTLDANYNLGTCRNGYGYGGTAKKSNNRNFDDYGEPYGLHDIIGCCIDMDRGNISYYKNGKMLGMGFATIQTRQTFFPAIVLKNAEVDLIFDGSTDYSKMYQGFKPIAQCPNLKPGKNIGAKGKKKDLSHLAKMPSAIIIEPSRELALQTANNVKMFSKYVPGVSHITLIGGTNAAEQIAKLKEGIDIIIATPGRLDDFLANGHVCPDNVRFLVIDEADAIIKDNKKFIENLHRACPPAHPSDGKKLQVIVCSATLHNFDIKKLAQSIMKFPMWVDLKGQDSVPDTVHHCVCLVKPRIDRTWENPLGLRTDGVHQKDNTRAGTNSQEQWSESIKVLKALYTLKFIQVHKCDKGIIFCRTKLDCDNMEKFLTQNDKSISVACLHSDRRPPERKANLDKFKQNKVRFLICTDVAARGIDIKGIPFVINVTLPDMKENYVHRIGRVGRAERMGLAISFAAIDEKEKVWYHSNCNNRGRGCYNTNLTDYGGCCIWYNEKQLLTDIEEHLGVTIDAVQPSMKVPQNEFDGKVVYGEKLGKQKVSRGHIDEITPQLDELKTMEKLIQGSFLDLGYRRKAKLQAWLPSNQGT